MRRLFLALFILGLLSGTGVAQRVGEAAPNFRLSDADGLSVSATDFLGQPLMLNFWATWCPPCREELPLFQQVAQENPELQVFLINAGEGREEATRYLTDNGLVLRTAVNATTETPSDAEDTLEVARRYRVRGMPTTFFISAEGVIQSIFVGEIPADLLAERLAEIGVTWRP